MKRSLFLFVVIVSLSTYNVFAQVENNTFDYQAYQVKVQNFLKTLTPQEKIVYIMSQSKSSSSSSGECELDRSTKNKIDEIYDKLEEMDRKLRYGSYSLDCNCDCDCY